MNAVNHATMSRHRDAHDALQCAKRIVPHRPDWLLREHRRVSNCKQIPGIGFEDTGASEMKKLILLRSLERGFRIMFILLKKSSD